MSSRSSLKREIGKVEGSGSDKSGSKRSKKEKAIIDPEKVQPFDTELGLFPEIALGNREAIYEISKMYGDDDKEHEGPIQFVDNGIMKLLKKNKMEFEKTKDESNIFTFKTLAVRQISNIITFVSKLLQKKDLILCIEPDGIIIPVVPEIQSCTVVVKLKSDKAGGTGRYYTNGERSIIRLEHQEFRSAIQAILSSLYMVLHQRLSDRLTGYVRVVGYNLSGVVGEIHMSQIRRNDPANPNLDLSGEVIDLSNPGEKWEKVFAVNFPRNSTADWHKFLKPLNQSSDRLTITYKYHPCNSKGEPLPMKVDGSYDWFCHRFTLKTKSDGGAMKKPYRCIVRGDHIPFDINARDMVDEGGGRGGGVLDEGGAYEDIEEEGGDDDSLDCLASSGGVWVSYASYKLTKMEMDLPSKPIQRLASLIKDNSMPVCVTVYVSYNDKTKRDDLLAVLSMKVFGLGDLDMCVKSNYVSFD